jgi:hypothetical protein
MRHIELNENWNNKQPYSNIIIGKTIDTTPKYMLSTDPLNRKCNCSNPKCDCKKISEIVITKSL